MIDKQFCDSFAREFYDILATLSSSLVYLLRHTSFKITSNTGPLTNILPALKIQSEANAMAVSRQSDGGEYEIDTNYVVKIAITGKYDPLNGISCHQVND